MDFIKKIKKELIILIFVFIGFVIAKDLAIFVKESAYKTTAKTIVSQAKQFKSPNKIILEDGSVIIMAGILCKNENKINKIITKDKILIKKDRVSDSYYIYTKDNNMINKLLLKNGFCTINKKQHFDLQQSFEKQLLKSAQ